MREGVFFNQAGVTMRNEKDIISNVALCILVTDLVSSVLSNYKKKLTCSATVLPTKKYPYLCLV